MTVSTTTTYAEAAAGATVYYFTFRCDAASWVKTYVGGVLTTTGITVALNADQDASPGGSVTFLSAATETVRIERDTPLTQEVNYNDYDAFPAATHEAALDKLTLAVQDADRDAAGGVVVEAALRLAGDTAEAAARVAADAAILALGTGAVVNLSNCPATATGATEPRTVADRLADYPTPLDYGALGTFDPDTETGPDDTAAVQACVTASRTTYLPKGYVFKCSSTIVVPSGHRIVGAGMHASALWFENGATVDGVQLGNVASYSDAGDSIDLLDFSILGGAAPGRYAITAKNMIRCGIRVNVGGRWDHAFRVWRQDLAGENGSSGIDGSNGGGGGVEHCEIDLTQIHADSGWWFRGSPNWIPNPKYILYIRGWANGSSIFVNATPVQPDATAAYGIKMEGSYGSANDCSVAGSIQGIPANGQPVILGGIANAGTRLRDVHCESTLTNEGILVTAGTNIKLGPNVMGGIVRLSGTVNTVMEGVLGDIRIAADNVSPIFIAAGAADAGAVTNLCPTLITIGFPKVANYSSLRGQVGFTAGDAANLVRGGDFGRFYSVAQNQVWGLDGYYVATKCGTGKTDTTRTWGAPYCAIIEELPGWGSMCGGLVASAAELTGMEGQLMVLSAKWKHISGGTNLSFRLVASALDGTGATLASASSVACESGFSLCTQVFKITAAMVAGGVYWQASFASGEKNYISEVQAMLGVAAPRNYTPVRFDRVTGVEVDAFGAMTHRASAAPAAGGDPAFNRAWQVGDRVVNSAPTVGQPKAWVCTVAGSPGTWVSEGNL